MTTSLRTPHTAVASAPLVGDSSSVLSVRPPVSHPHNAASYLPQVLPVVEKLSALLGRPVRVLDLGVDPNAFAQHLHSQGASIATASPEDLAADASYDLVLCFGTRALSEPVERPQLEALGRRTGILLADSSDIEAARSVLSGVFSFAHDLPPAGPGQPAICFASNRYWLLGGRMAAFDTTITDPHAVLLNAHLGTRRGYVGSGVIAKTYDLSHPSFGARNRAEWESETRYLRNVPPGMSAPALILSGEHGGEAWLVREHVEGRTLVELIEDGTPYDSAAILRCLLVELAALERAGLCHRDVRPWNVVVRPDGHATLIDYGAIAPEFRAASAPTNPFASFMIFAHEVFTRTMLWAHSGSTPTFRLDLPEPFGGALRAMMLVPPEQWSFAGLLHHLDAPAPADALPPGIDTLLAAAAECGDALNSQVSVLTDKVRTSRAYEEELGRMHRRVSALAAAAQREAEQRRRADLGDATIASMLGSTSWRVTAPLRAIGRLIGRMTGRP